MITDEQLNSIPCTPARATISYSHKVKQSLIPSVRSSEDMYKVLKHIWEKIGGIDHYESFVILHINRANKILSWDLISKGGIAGTVADAIIIFQSAILSNCSSICLAHNHPSGNMKPSQSDDNLTKKIVAAGKILDLPVLDHLIICEESWYSYADEGRL